MLLHKRGATPSEAVEMLPMHAEPALGDVDYGAATTVPSAGLPAVDRPAFALLVVLYVLQGVPVGLAFGLVPFILKSKLLYAQVGIFLLAAYPYLLKLLWLPIVDALYLKKIGRRRSWIMPVQAVSGLVLVLLGGSIEGLLELPYENLGAITFAFFVLVLLCATQDIAVDGWALTTLSPSALLYALTAQTVGMNTGYFSSFTVFLAVSSPEFANKYLRAVPLETGLVLLSGYLRFWGFAYLAATAVVAMVPEYPAHLARHARLPLVPWTPTAANSPKGRMALVVHVYRQMLAVLRLPTVQMLIVVHLLAKIGFQANEAATNLKLLEKGFSKEDLATTVLIDFPFEILFGYYAAQWSNGKNPLTPWLYAYLGRLASAAIAMLLVATFPASGPTPFYFFAVMVQHMLGLFMSTIQFVSICAFHTKIADPAIGGTYMTLLNTVLNLGGQWPRIIVLALIDRFTASTCMAPAGTAPLGFSCARGGARRCGDAGGTCVVTRDGYFSTGMLCVAVGLAVWFWLRRRVVALSNTPTAAWRTGSPA